MPTHTPGALLQGVAPHAERQTCSYLCITNRGVPEQELNERTHPDVDFTHLTVQPPSTSEQNAVLEHTGRWELRTDVKIARLDRAERRR